MMLMTEMAPQTGDSARAVPARAVRKTRCNVAGASMLRPGPQANPRRIRLTSPGNPVHR